MKSSLIRMSLAKHIRQVASCGEDLCIEHDSREIAVLSLTPPRTGTKPLRMLSADAQSGWADLLSIVSVRGARYYFKLKPLADGPEMPRVYLYRTKSSNRFTKDWNEHRDAQIQKQAPADYVGPILKSQESLASALALIQAEMEKLNSTVQSLNQVQRWTFAAVNRDGHLLNTPEMGVVPPPKLNAPDDSED